MFYVYVRRTCEPIKTLRRSITDIFKCKIKFFLKGNSFQLQDSGTPYKFPLSS